MSEIGQNQLLEEKENFIILTLKIKQKQFSKVIYFLDNMDYVDLNGEEHLHNNLKELNTRNVDLYINGIKFEIKKYFIPEKKENIQ